jgi:hypothetical protein
VKFIIEGKQITWLVNYLCMLLAGNGINCSPWSIIRQHLGVESNMGESVKVNSMKGHVTHDETSQCILNGCYTSPAEKWHTNGPSNDHG